MSSIRTVCTPLVGQALLDQAGLVWKAMYGSDAVNGNASSAGYKFVSQLVSRIDRLSGIVAPCILQMMGDSSLAIASLLCVIFFFTRNVPPSSSYEFLNTPIRARDGALRGTFLRKGEGNSLVRRLVVLRSLSLFHREIAILAGGA